MKKYLTLFLLLFLVGCASVPQPPEQPQLTEEQKEKIVKHFTFQEIEQVFENCVLIRIVGAAVDNELIDRNQVYETCFNFILIKYPSFADLPELEAVYLTGRFHTLMNNIK